MLVTSYRSESAELELHVSQVGRQMAVRVM